MVQVAFQWLVFSICLGLSVVAKAKILLVSDIDDTLKISHVRNSWDSINNSMAVENHFLGMSELLKAASLKQDLQVVYVSNAPAALMQWSHEKFLSYNYFPQGEVFLRDFSGDETHKLRTISRLIEESQPELVILIGDNGERDPMDYKSLEEKYPHIRFYTWIHQIYSVLASSEKGEPLQKNQRGFATSIDLALDMKSKGLIAENQWLWHLQNFVPKVLKEPLHSSRDELAFPGWMDCRDYFKQHTQDELALPQPVQKLELQMQYEWKMKARCANPL